jgi:hypothetical protein
MAGRLGFFFFWNNWQPCDLDHKEQPPGRIKYLSHPLMLADEVCRRVTMPSAEFRQ